MPVQPPNGPRYKIGEGDFADPLRRAAREGYILRFQNAITTTMQREFGNNPVDNAIVVISMAADMIAMVAATSPDGFEKHVEFLIEALRVRALAHKRKVMGQTERAIENNPTKTVN